MVKRKTAQGRLSRALMKIAHWCRLHRHDPIATQHQTLSQKLRGHFAYYGITGNGVAIQRLPGRGGAYLAEVVVSPTSSGLPLLDYVRPAAEALRASRGHRGPLGVPSGKQSRDLTSRMR